jgi:antitoxin FitA
VTSLNIPKLEPKIMPALRIQAARHGISMEEEIREILKRRVQSQHSISDIAFKLFGLKQGVHLKLSRHPAHQPLDLFDLVN